MIWCALSSKTRRKYVSPAAAFTLDSRWIRHVLDKRSNGRIKKKKNKNKLSEILYYKYLGVYFPHLLCIMAARLQCWYYVYTPLDEYCCFNPSSRFSAIIIYILFPSRAQRLILLLCVKDSSHHLIRVLSDSYPRACIILRFLKRSTQLYIQYVIRRCNSLFIHFWNGLFFLCSSAVGFIYQRVQPFVKILCRCTCTVLYVNRPSHFVYLQCIIIIMSDLYPNDRDVKIIFKNNGYPTEKWRRYNMVLYITHA